MTVFRAKARRLRATRRGNAIFAIAAKMCAGIPDRAARNRCVAQAIKQLKAQGY